MEKKSEKQSEETKESLSMSEKVAWNLSNSLIEQISHALYLSSDAYMKGEIFEAFNCLKIVYQRIVNTLNPKERDMIQALELKFLLALKHKEESKHIYACDQYNNKIMDLLEIKGFTIGKKIDVTKFG